MKIYTRTGDSGETGLCGAGRVSKDSARMEVCGTIDELNAVFGVVCVCGASPRIKAVIERIQAELFDIGAEVASPDPVAIGTRRIGDKHVGALENDIDRFSEGLAALGEFIVPGGSMASAQLHVARTVCRRAERRLVALITEEGDKISPQTLVYINRLGDLLFVLARAANADEGLSDRLRPKA